MHRPVPEERIGEFAGTSRGLTRVEVERQLARYGPNNILDAPQHPWRDLALDTAKDPMLWFLLGVSALYGVLGERAESVTLLISAIPLIGMDAFLHRRTQASTEGLRVRLASRATVIRDAIEVELPVEEIVPGDLAIVSASEHFPADGILVEGEELQADESALTGEAYPVRKRPFPAPVDLVRAVGGVEDRHWGFAGTRLLTGRARLRVVWTGEVTLYGEIARSARLSAHARTPLQRAIGQLVRFLVIAAAALCAILAIVRIQQGFGWVDALVSAMTLAVAALPEEFPVIFTVFLGVGVYRLARQKALVRRAVSVENIGRVSCICSDKTGTITLGELQLVRWVPNSAIASEQELRVAAALASRHESGDPLDVAVFRAIDAGPIAVPSFEVFAAFPFTEDRRRETAIARTPEGLQIATKGAPETILSLCELSESERNRWTQRADSLAVEGYKVTACATRFVPGDVWLGGEPDRDFALVGLLAFEDPVREGVPDAIARSRASGIRVLMVTGDHPGTAIAVARQLGLGDGTPRVVLGEELDALLSDGRPGALANVDVVARAIPSQKLAIVRAFQADGEIVAVTGDGVNDVPALQAADVGIAMGERATRSAREIAAIVLLDDNFRTIVRAIAEGRQLFDNLKRSFRYLLMIHIPLVMSAALIPLAGYPILYLPIHIVWLELVIHPSAMLAFQDAVPDGSLGDRRDRPYDIFFSRQEWGVIGLVGLLTIGLVVYGYLENLGTPTNVEHARAMALLVLSVASAGFVAVLSGLRTRVARWIALLTVALAGVLIQTPSLSTRLHMEPLHLGDWWLALGGGAAACAPMLIAEIVQQARGSRVAAPR
jgi:Ca2+-transporting ATPase